MRPRTAAFAAVALLTGVGVALIVDLPLRSQLWAFERSCGAVTAATRLSRTCQERALSLGHALSQGRAYLAARVWYDRAAQAGELTAMFHLAWTYEQIGQQRDAQHWYEKAAEHQFAPAMVNLGDRAAFGIGTDRNGMEAYQWFIRAAALGNPLGGRNMFAHNDAGTGANGDRDALARWWRSAPRRALDPRDLEPLTFKRTRLMGQPGPSDIAEAVRVWPSVQAGRDGRVAPLSKTVDKPFHGVAKQLN